MFIIALSMIAILGLIMTIINFKKEYKIHLNSHKILKNYKK
mgnify:FL=1|jgi:hypothetical protein